MSIVLLLLLSIKTNCCLLILIRKFFNIIKKVSISRCQIIDKKSYSIICNYRNETQFRNSNSLFKLKSIFEKNIKELQNVKVLIRC